jgi:hypothetical protein
VTGALRDRRAFAATGALNAINPGKSPAAAALAAGATKAKYWPAPAQLLVLKSSSCVDGGPVAKGPDPVKAPEPAKDDGKDKGQKGRGATKDRISVRVPEGAAPAALEVSISVEEAAAAPDREVRRIEADHKGLVEAAPAVEFGPTGTRFATPVTLELPYDPASLPAGADEARLSVHYWNPATRAWEKLDSIVDRQAKVVRAQTTHFSTYQVFFGVAATADLSFVDAYAFPSPSRAGAPITLRIQPGTANTVEFSVYDVAGRKVHSSNDFTYRAAFDDGNGKGPQDTYDHLWDVSGAGSGVYTWAITARKDGGSTVRKTGKLAVIK